jgi:hypothetical protein
MYAAVSFNMGNFEFRPRVPILYGHFSKFCMEPFELPHRLLFHSTQRISIPHYLNVAGRYWPILHGDFCQFYVEYFKFPSSLPPTHATISFHMGNFEFPPLFDFRMEIFANHAWSILNFLPHCCFIPYGEFRISPCCLNSVWRFLQILHGAF